MELKVTKKKFLQAIEEYDGYKGNDEIAEILGISQAYFYRLKKRYIHEIQAISREIAYKSAARNINNLQKIASGGGKGAVTANRILLEIADVYQPFSRRELTGADGKPLELNIIVEGAD